MQPLLDRNKDETRGDSENQDDLERENDARIRERDVAIEMLTRDGSKPEAPFSKTIRFAEGAISTSTLSTIFDTAEKGSSLSDEDCPDISKVFKLFNEVVAL